MAKILFVVNAHPNESFSALAARDAAKRLRRQGHEVVWEKIKPEDTALGKVLKSEKGRAFAEKELHHLVDGVPMRKTFEMARKHSPAATYSFHSSPVDSRFWERRKGTGFYIGTMKAPPGYNVRVVEIKAAYREMPKGVVEKARKATGKQLEKTQFNSYLTRTTSVRKTRAAGLLPNELGKAIAGSVMKDMEAISQGMRLRAARGRIPRKKAKTPQKRRRRPRG